MRKPRASWLIGVVIGAWALASCAVSPVQVTAGSTTAPPQATSTPTMTPTQEPTPEESATTSLPTVTLPDDQESDDVSSPTPSEEASEDESTADDGSDETSDEATVWTKPTGDTHLIGKVVYAHRVEKDDGTCGLIRDVVLDVSDNGVKGIRGAQFHDDSKWGIGQDLYRGKQIYITISPDDYHPMTLEQGDEPFPVKVSHCDMWYVPGSFYGHPFLKNVPYNAATWETR